MSQIIELLMQGYQKQVSLHFTSWLRLKKCTRTRERHKFSKHLETIPKF
jgi:hypothetical protein